MPEPSSPAPSPPAPLRVWLEPGYDGGRWGVWLLDLPGAFGWQPTREAALSQATSVAGWFRDWLAGHGDDASLPPIAGLDVVEEVPADVLDGHERNATFAADRRPLGRDELETTLRRLTLARDDLLDLVERVARHEAAHGPLDPADPAARAADGSPGRTADEVLRHLASAEIWLGSRLDPAARFAGPPRDGDARAYLDATRAWAVDGLRRLQRLDSALARTDGKGEDWTLPKVVRRYLYHSLDHLRELDRRLARAEGRADRLAVRDDRLADPAPLVRLLRSVGWDHRAADVERLRRALAGSTATEGAWDGERLVGFARLISDGAFTAIVSMVMVDPAWQGLGIASRLVGRLMEGRDELRFDLDAAPGVEGVYARLGFEPNRHAMTRRRRR